MIREFFTSRVGGVSSGSFTDFNLALHVGDEIEAVVENREILARALGLTSDRVFYMDQVHGDEIAMVERSRPASQPPKVDALITQESDTALVVLVADCIPLLFRSPSAIAAVHVGRAGLVAGIVEAAIAKLENLGASRSEISAQIGPSICGSCYEVSPEIYLDVISNYPAAATTLAKHTLNLPGAVISILDSYEIEYSRENSCTAHGENLFSYRRDGVTGRQAGVIAW